MEFKRATRLEYPACASVRVWDSRCGIFRVRESILIGEETPIYYAQQYVDGIWTVLKRHRKRDAAVRTLERAERGLPPIPKSKTARSGTTPARSPTSRGRRRPGRADRV